MGTALFKYGTYGQTDNETERLDMIESSFVDKKDRIAQLYKLNYPIYIKSSTQPPYAVVTIERVQRGLT